MTAGTSESSAWCVVAGPSSDMWPRVLVINTTLVGGMGLQGEVEDPAQREVHTLTWRKVHRQSEF